jgi:hypothetical protein
MPKITSADIDALLFKPEMFGKTGENFKEFVQSIIDDEAETLEGRIGSSAYASATKPTSTYVKKAEKCLVAAELCTRRKNKCLDDAKVNGQEFDTRELNKQMADYQTKAEMWIGKIAAGATADGSDFSCGTVLSDHFGETT